MKQFLLFFISIIFISACGGVKKTSTALNTGNYDQAITQAMSKLYKNKEKKGKQPYIIILEQAFAKAVTRDKNSIVFLEKESNPENLEKIYETYVLLKNRQESIKPLLPLGIVEKGRNAKFQMENYDAQIIASKDKLTNYLYEKSNKLLINARSKGDYRAVYKDLNYLQRINPNYKNVNQLIDEAHFKGTDFVRVNMKNNTQKVIPKRLETDLLNFDTYGLNNLWTVYHGAPQSNVNYDYEMEVSLRQINISPEKVTERQLEKEKTINDGWEYLTDKDGNAIKDEEGNKIKVDKTKRVRCEYYEFTQFKAVNVVGQVLYRNLATRQLLKTFPLSSEYIFEHIYANYNGDKRALDNDLVRFLGLQAVSFPSNEQMIYDSGQDLKNKLKGIIGRQRFN